MSAIFEWRNGKFGQVSEAMVKKLIRDSVSIVVILLTFLSVSSASSAFAAEALNWNTNRNRVSADIKSEPLLNLLEQIAGATGWRVLVEPDTLHTVSTKFKELTPGDALHLLLGDVNFALVPGTNSSSRLFVFRTSRERATQVVHPLKRSDSNAEPKPIPNELIVRLKPGMKIDELAKLLGAKVIGRVDSLNAYRLQFDDQAATTSAREQLASNPDVASVESNYAIERPEVPQAISGSAPLPQLQLKPPSGEGRIIIGLVDTGVQSLGNNLDQFILKQLSVAGDAQLDPNSPSHGTSMAETMLRTLQMLGNGSSSVQILPVDVYGPNEATSTFDVAEGIALAINKGANPINLSLGSPADSQLVRDLIAEGNQKGITFYAAKGNTPDTTPFYPAADAGVTAVTALDRNGQVAPWANKAAISSVGAPGTVLVTFNNQTYVVQGTSPATAMTSATASSLMDTKSLSATDARGQILQNATPVTVPVATPSPK
jgi:hypothetical protein